MMLTTPAASQNKAFPLAGSLNRLSLSESHIKHRNSPSLPAHRNLLIKLNCAEMELANSLILSRNAQSVCREIKHEKYSGSVKPENYSGSAVIQHGCIYENQQVKSKEKGGTENTALWGYGFFHHELNQHLAARQDLQLVRNYSQNPYMLNDSSNLRNDNANLRNYKNQHIAEQYARTCESFVGHRVTVSKPVQPFGSIPSRSSRWRQESLTHELKLPCPATESICSSSESSKRMFFTVLLERSNSRFVFFSCIGIYQWCSVFVDGIYHLVLNQELKTAKPGSALTLTGPLTTNVNVSNEVAMLNHTPTRFKFLFLAVCRSDLNAKPHRESVTAHSEQDARRSLAGQFVLSFAGRLPEVNHA